MVDKDQIENVLGRLSSVEAELGDPVVLQDRKRYRAVLADYSFLKKLDSAWTMYQLAVDDGQDQELIRTSERDVTAALLKPDPFEARNAVLEIRAGTGGEEAALFAGDLFRMYSRFCETKGWKVSVMHSNQTSLDGYKEIVFTAKGPTELFDSSRARIASSAFPRPRRRGAFTLQRRRSSSSPRRTRMTSWRFPRRTFASTSSVLVVRAASMSTRRRVRSA